jgi:hypothetical protein
MEFQQVGVSMEMEPNMPLELVDFKEVWPTWICRKKYRQLQD